MAATATKSAPTAHAQSSGQSTATQDLAKPSSMPPGAETQNGGSGASTAEAVPLTLSNEELARMMDSSTALITPTLEPPALKESAGGATATVWKTGKVNALWSINQNRNSWAGFDNGIGWQKFANNSDSAIMAFTILASHARDAQGTNSIRQETSDNMVHEIYVW